MSAGFDDKIRRSRQLLQNPYAYLDGDGGYTILQAEPPANVHEARRILENQYAYLDEHGGYGEWPGHKDDRASSTALIDLSSLLEGRVRGKGFSKHEVEAIARRLHIALWRRRAEIWPARQQVHALDILDPSVALTSIGYSVRIAESLGQYSAAGELFEVAGVLDNSKFDVQISRRFSPEIRNFTIAHELGHALLHTRSGLHRDRALDGSGGGLPRDPSEAEADLFASYFLLPERPVREMFEKVFLTQRFMMNDDTAFALTSQSLESLQSKCRTLRDLARVLADAEYYNGVHFHSMAKQFQVSTEAMAIRLEELGLVER